MALTTNSKFELLSNFNGGLVTRSTPLLLEGTPSKKVFSPALRNIDMFKSGSISKRLGKTIQGSVITGTNPINQTSVAAGSIGMGFTATTNAICTFFVASATQNLLNSTWKVGFNANALINISSIRVTVRTNSGGSPGTILTNGTSNSISPLSSQFVASVNKFITFTWATPPSVTSASTYWVCLEFIATASTGSIFFEAALTSTNSKNTTDNYSTFAAIADPYLVVTLNTPAINGIFDYRYGSASTQAVIASTGGVLYYHARNATPLTGSWTSLISSLGSGQDVLWDFKSFKNYLFSNDYGTNIGQVWEGASTSTSKHGYRLTPYYGVTSGSLAITSTAGSTITMSASQYAGGIYVGKQIYLYGSATVSPQLVTIKSYVTTGTVGQATYYVTSIVVNENIYTDHTSVKFNGATVINNGGAGSINTTAPLTCFSILQVTSLRSGGFRCAEFSMDTEATNTSQIEFTTVAINSSTNGTQYSFDISSLATTWYMTAAFDPTVGLSAPIYYKIPTANMSTGNPFANSTTAFNITAITNLTTSSTLVTDYGNEQGYFTSQVDTPITKYLEIFQNMLASAGDAINPSRVWFSELNAPQIWSTRGGLEGNYLDLNPNDGDVIVGLKEWNGVLYVFKRKSVIAIEYTGVEGQPFYVRTISKTLGALSHWCIKEVTNKGLVFLSQRGPAICLGTVVQMIPSASNILDRFDPNNSSRYNLAAMRYITAGINVSKSQIHFGVSSTSVSQRDLTLVYDYEKDAWWENDVSANYYTEVTDTASTSDSTGSFSPSIWSGNYSASIFQHDSGTNDNGVPINFTFETPDMSFGAPFFQKYIDQIMVSGTVQSSGTLYVDVFTDFAASSTTPAVQLSFDMTASTFKRGQSCPVGIKATEVRFLIRNSVLDVPVQVDSIGFTYQLKEMVP